MYFGQRDKTCEADRIEKNKTRLLKGGRKNKKRMIFGTNFAGTFKKQNEQFITSELVFIAVAVEVNSTFLATKKKGRQHSGN